MSETQLVMASEWMTNGNVNEFTKAHGGADRLGLVSSLFNVSYHRWLIITQPL